MPSTMPLRVGNDLLASAKLAAEAAGRSAAQQIGYWAKLGRELERSGTVSVREIAEVLAGARSYDDLDVKAQATVRAEWDARIEARRAALNLAERFTAEGRSWVDAGRDGGTLRQPVPGEGRTPGRRQRSSSAAEGAPSNRSSRATSAAAKKTLVKKAAAKKKTSRAR